LLLAQTAHHGISGFGLYASFCKIRHFGQFFKGRLVGEIGLYASIYGKLSQ